MFIRKEKKHLLKYQFFNNETLITEGLLFMWLVLSFYVVAKVTEHGHEQNKMSGSIRGKNTKCAPS
jgi:hypothetical protein